MCSLLGLPARNARRELKALFKIGALPSVVGVDGLGCLAPLIVLRARVAIRCAALQLHLHPSDPVALTSDLSRQERLEAVDGRLDFLELQRIR